MYLTNPVKKVLRCSVYGVMLAAITFGCGKKDDASSDAPPPSDGGTPKEKAFSLQSGSYTVSNLTNLQDGCGLKPTAEGNSITDLKFTLTNDGSSNVTINLCSGGQEGVHGPIKGNQGTLTTEHLGRHVGTDPLIAVYDQSCTASATVTKDNTVHLNFKESQSNRNQVERDATADLAECETAFDFDLTRQQQ